MLHLAKKFFRWHTDVDSSFFSGAHVVGLPVCRNTSLRNTFFPLIPLHLWSIAPSHVFGSILSLQTEINIYVHVFLGLFLLPPSNVSWDRWYSQSHHSLLALVQKRAISRLLFYSASPPNYPANFPRVPVQCVTLTTRDLRSEYVGLLLTTALPRFLRTYTIDVPSKLAQYP